jgi:hypothetical protein
MGKRCGLAVGLLVVLWSAVVVAAPGRALPRPATARSSDAGWLRADALWIAAEQGGAGAQAEERWRAAAEAFEQVAADAAVDATVRRESALVAVLAWRNAQEQGRDAGMVEVGRAEAPPPAPLTELDRRLIAAVDRYLALTPPPPADDVARVRFLRGVMYRRRHHTPEAVADLGAVAEGHRGSDVGELAVNLLLDLLVQARRYDEMAVWVDRVRADAPFLSGHPDMAARLALLKQQILRKRAEQLEKAGRDRGGRDAYGACGDAYREAFEIDPQASHGDELLYNAAICYELAGSASAALVLYGRVADAGRGSPLGRRALGRRGALSLRIARFADAADDGERAARQYAGEPDSRAQLADAAFLRVALGQLDRAERDLRLLSATSTASVPRTAEGLAGLAVAIARGHLERGQRRDAARVAALALSPRWIAGDPALGLAAAETAWEAACPVSPTSGLCLTPGSGRTAARDRALAATARARLQAIDLPRARLLLADAAFEEALALADAGAGRSGGTAKGAALQRAIARARDAYAALAGEPRDDVDIAAHARLGQLSLFLTGRSIAAPTRLGPARRGWPLATNPTAQTELETCRRLAIDRLHPTPWLPVCERNLAVLDALPPPDRELRPMPTATPPVDREPPQL